MKKGFTLAELLIALAIVGAISVMTIPTLVSNYRAHVASVRLKKFYSNMRTVIQISEIKTAEQLIGIKRTEFIMKTAVTIWKKITKMLQLSLTGILRLISNIRQRPCKIRVINIICPTVHHLSFGTSIVLTYIMILTAMIINRIKWERMFLIS